MAEDSKFIFKWNSHLPDITSKLHYMLARETLVDATLISAEGKSMKVHRLMLCAASKMFEEIFIQQSSMRPVTIKLKDVKMKDLQSVIEFIYKGEISVSCSQLPSLLKAASSLKIIGLMEQVKLGFDLHQIHSLATTPAESPDVTNNTAMVYDAEIRSIEKRDQSNDNEKEEQHKTEETGMSNEELMEQNDDGESRIAQYDDPNEYLSQHSSIDGVDLSDDSSDEEMGAISTARAYSQPHCPALEPKPKVNSQPKKKGMVHSNSGSQTGAPEKPFKCSKCGRTYSRKDGMRRHFLHECGKEPRFRCPQCDYQTHWKQVLQTHLIGFHKVDRSQLAAFGAESKTIRATVQDAFQQRQVPSRLQAREQPGLTSSDERMLGCPRCRVSSPPGELF